MKFGIGSREWDEGVVVKANRIRQLLDLVAINGQARRLA